MRDGSTSDTRQLAVVAESVDLEELKPEDQVLCWSLDGGNLLLLTRHLGVERPEVRDHGKAGAVERGDIVGLDDILEEVDLLFLTADSPAAAAMLRAAGRSAAGLLLQGPPGCGKSMVADYAATRVRRSGGTALHRTGSDYLSKWVGEGAERMRSMPRLPRRVSVRSWWSTRSRPSRWTARRRRRRSPAGTSTCSTRCSAC
jgi:ATP-dependent 26S proteasome regulatory subunit